MVTQQPIFFFANDSASTTITEYISINSKANAWNSNDNIRKNILPTNGKFVKLNIQLGTAPGAGKSYQFGLYVNGSLSTTLKGTISDTDTTLTVSADQAITTGDVVSLECIPTSTPTAMTTIDGNIIWEPTIDDEYLILGSSSDSLDPSATEYHTLETNGTHWVWTGSENNAKQNIPASGNLTKFYAETEATPGGAATYTVTVRINKASTALSLVLTDADFDQVDSSSVPTSAGDVLTLQCIPASTPDATPLMWGCVFIPTVSGEIPLLGGTSDNINTSVTEYNNFGQRQSWNGTIGSVDMMVYNETITVKAMYIQLTTTPGLGNNYDFDFVIDGSPQASLNCNIADTANNTNATGASVVVSSGEKISLECVPTGTPNGVDGYFGIVFTYVAGSISTFIPRMVTY